MAIQTLTLPGRIGDDILRLPVSYAWASLHEEKVGLIFDERSRCVADFAAGMPWVRSVEVTSGRVTGYDLGGTPADMGYGEREDMIHLGFREFPPGNITDLCAGYAGLSIRPSLAPIPGFPLARRPGILASHTESCRDHANIPSFETIERAMPQIEALFAGHLAITTQDPDRPEVRNHYHRIQAVPFSDYGRLRKTAMLLSNSLLIGTYSSMASLAGILHSPQVVITDDRETIGHWREPYYPAMRVVREHDVDALVAAVKELMGA